MSALAVAGLIIGALFVLWTVAVCVYLLGSAMKRLNAVIELEKDRASIWRWGVAYALALLCALFLLVRFVKFAWEL